MVALPSSLIDGDDGGGGCNEDDTAQFGQWQMHGTGSAPMPRKWSIIRNVEQMNKRKTSTLRKKEDPMVFP